MKKPQGRLDKLCRQLNIAIVKSTAPRIKGKQTKSRSTLKKILARHGQEHLVLTIRCITDGANNQGQLYSETIGAVSDVLAVNPDLKELGIELLDAFAVISLEHIRNQVKAMGFSDGTRRFHIRALIACELQDILDKGK